MKLPGKRTILCILLPIMFGVPAVWSAENSPPAPVRNLKKEYAGNSGQARTYDEWFVDRNEAFVRDPYLWVYNASFAKDFHMPDRWIDADLKGADAVAFRVDRSFPMCGYRGKPDICSAVYVCLLEIYFNHERNPLPWNEKLRWTDMQISNTSIKTLISLRSMNRIESVEGGRRSPLVDPKSGNELDWRYFKGANSPLYGAPSWEAYDRTAFENYSFIMLRTYCPDKELAGLDLRTYFSEDRSEKVFHKIVFPKNWIERLSPIFQRINSEKSEFFRSQLKELGFAGVER